jgi:hypothetical protein
MPVQWRRYLLINSFLWLYDVVKPEQSPIKYSTSLNPKLTLTLTLTPQKNIVKNPKSKNKTNPNSKETILKYCTQKPTQIQKTSKENYKENKSPQIPKSNPQIAKNKTIRKNSKSYKKPPIHIKKIIAEIPQSRNQTTQKNIIINQKKLKKYQNIAT